MTVRNLMCIFLLISFSHTFAQKGMIKGKLIDADGESIFGANIFLKGTVLGTTSNEQGAFEINNVLDGEYELTISFIGYKQENRQIKIMLSDTLDLGSIILYPMTFQSDPVVLTASKYEQKLRDIPISISSINKEDIRYRNNLSIEDVLKYVSGINMNSDQVNIRGSNGFSMGVGSRVMMLIDGVPYITGDTQGLVFDDIPVNHVERLEIIKGAGSALYGSSAIGGVINVITKPISSTPELHFKMYGGFYSEPYYSEWKWTDNPRYLHGLGIEYSHKPNKVGYRFAVSRDHNDSHKKNDWKTRYNMSGKVECDFSKKSKLSVSGNYMDMQRGNFLYWENLRNALVPPDEQLNEKVHAKRSYLSSSYRKTISENQLYKISAIWYHNYFIDNVGAGNHSTSDYFNLEFQYNKSIEKHFLVFGFTPTYNRVTSNIFGSNSGFGFAAFMQDEIKWNEKWITTFGGRLDYAYIDKLGSDVQFNPKLGVVFKPDVDNAFRASCGTGFRAPSMAEIFTNTEAGGIPVIPNEELKPERSVTLETGWNRTISELCIADISVFYNHYWDLIEGGFYEFENEGLYVQFENVTEAKIYGIECNLNWWVIKNELQFNSGYTLIESKNLATKTYLNYRPRNLLYSGIQYKYKKYKIGTDYRYLSRYDCIDESFNLYIEDADKRSETHVLDVHCSANFSINENPLNVSIHVNNLLQYHYIDFVGSIAPVRNIVLTINMTL